jgi:2-oxoglutarate ferredoxin oxidoreductase subunit alpha
MYGRNGESPVPIIAAASPADCFNATIEAFTIATKYMTPVVLLSDGYLANGSEPWMVPDVSRLPRITITHPTEANDDRGYMPYKRDEHGARPWAIPGTPGLEHRIGGIEKQDVTGNVNYEPENHERMVNLRAAKVAELQPAGPDVLWTGPEKGDVLIVGWGSTFGAIKAGVLELRRDGLNVSACHIRYLNPLPQKLGDMMGEFTRVLVPEMNLGQLRLLLRGKYMVDAKGLNKVRGQPFTIREITEGVRDLLAGKLDESGERVPLRPEDTLDANIAGTPGGG